MNIAQTDLTVVLYYIPYAVFAGNENGNLWAVVGGCVVVLAVITLVTVTVVLVRRRPGSESDGDNSDLSSLNDLSTDIAKSVKTVK
jgi:hypothetical protein